MITATRPTAISGVSASRETEMMTIYPSIAATWPGRCLGRLYDSIPVRICGIKLSHLLFVLPTAPGALKVYFYLKFFGERYSITNRSMQRWRSLGRSLIKQVPLTEIADVAISQQAGQKFYRAADLVLLNEKGERIMTLAGVPYPEMFRETLLEARDARTLTAASLAVIQSRGE